MLIAAAVVPTPPLLVPAVAAGSAPRDEPLRRHVLTAAEQVLTAGPDVVVVVGSAPQTRPYDGQWDWSPFGVPARRTEHRLPLSLAIGDWLLDQLSWSGLRRFAGVGSTAPAATCLELGESLADASPRVALLVCGGGSACRTEQAPGHLDPRAAAFDGAAARALADADVAGLLALDAQLADELHADGRAAWQVLAGSARSGSWDARLLYDDAPYGVAYFVSTWHRLDVLEQR